MFRKKKKNLNITRLFHRRNAGDVVCNVFFYTEVHKLKFGYLSLWMYFYDTITIKQLSPVNHEIDCLAPPPPKKKKREIVPQIEYPEMSAEEPAQNFNFKKLLNSNAAPTL